MSRYGVHMAQLITPAIWCNGDADEAARFYADVFREEHALDMTVDLMFDRGFSVRTEERVSADGKGGFRFDIAFAPPQLHNVAAEKAGPAGAKGDAGR